MDSVRGRRGFTLVELLVVIAVIALLAAILFPVFAQAREKARQAGCLSNLQQIGRATMMYVQDFDETFPGGPRSSFFSWNPWVPGPEGSWEEMPTKHGNVAPISVALRLLPYLKSPRIFFCSNDPNGDRFVGDWDPRFTRLSYYWQEGVSLGLSWPTLPHGRMSTSRPLSLSEIASPALLPLIFDWSPDVHTTWPAPPRQNICFADGHAKFSRVVQRSNSPGQAPWIWDYYNPRQPVDVQKPCSPTCAEEAARD